MYQDFTELARQADTLARQLQQLQWGQPTGPTEYEDLPDSLIPAARQIDQIGDHLAQFRQKVYQDDIDPEEAIPQAQLIAEVLAQQVIPEDREGLPDIDTVWLKSDLGGDEFNRLALETALRFYAHKGEPNVFRETEGPKGRPSMRDVQALQKVTKTLLEVCQGMEEFGQILSTQLEEFVRYHWSNAPDIQGLVGVKEALEGNVEVAMGRPMWEEHPMGQAILSAVGAVQHLPAEQAEMEGAPNRDGDGGNDWDEPTSRNGRNW